MSLLSEGFSLIPSLYSTKVMLLHIRNILPSIRSDHFVFLKVTHENLDFILNEIKYNEYKWLICADLNFVAILNGLQADYTKFMFFVTMDSRARDEHYTRTEWSLRNESKTGPHNVMREPLVAKENTILLPLYIKLGLMKQFLKTLNHDNPSFSYFKTKFPRVSDSEIKEGIS